LIIDIMHSPIYRSNIDTNARIQYILLSQHTY